MRIAIWSHLRKLKNIKLIFIIWKNFFFFNLLLKKNFYQKYFLFFLKDYDNYKIIEIFELDQNCISIDPINAFPLHFFITESEYYNFSSNELN